MKVTELDELLTKLILESDHPEISEIERVPTEGWPDNHTRIVVRFANGASAVIMVRNVVRPGGRRHADFEVPAEVR
ncbi:hypothetical protein [Actinophytocola sp.]|uniref:hypothetical protein n=1 Tax=Actinophytocola sp. TaxID=1872138 RepID=UPI003D6C6AAD